MGNPHRRRKAVETGSVTMPSCCKSTKWRGSSSLQSVHGSELTKFRLFVILRSFLYNEGLSGNGGSTDKGVVDELIAAITPFYYSERLFILRILIPLFRAHDNTGDSIHDVATQCLPKILQDGHQFAIDLITEYLDKTEMVMLEVLFWTVWGYLPCDGPLVVRIFEAAYNTNLSSSQKNRVLYALCASLSVTQSSPATIIDHLSNPETTIASSVRIVQHPHEDLALRNAVWNFIALAVDKEPALSNLFVTGQFRVPNNKRRTLQTRTLAVGKTYGKPILLVSVFRFIDAVWRYGLEHKNLIDATRGNDEFWTNVTFVKLANDRRSSLHEAVSVQSYRNMVKSYAVRVIGQDIFLQLQPGPSEPAKKPLSYSKFAPSFKAEDQLNELILEAESTSYDPSLHDKLAVQLQQDFPGLSLTHLQSQDLSEERVFGDDFTFSIALLRNRLQHCASGDARANAVEEVEKRVASLNLNLSLTYAQTALAESWQFLLHQILPFEVATRGFFKFVWDS
ncbi:hypothetical protein DFH29DRAFT_1080709 [Suillus ampliporus]|nr:hypothetical protein DFH29DRAFT_1080709 [Suillus ampliporus]